MNISIASDHRGKTAADQLAQHLTDAGHNVRRVGPDASQSADYPDGAFAVSHDVAKGHSDRGILICGTGIGMSIAANKVAGVRAALVHDELTARLARSHNNANVLCLSGDLLSGQKIEKIVDTFVETDFEGGRHARRVEKISIIETGKDPGKDPGTA